MPAVEEQALNLRNRVKALEDTLDVHFENATTEAPPAEETTKPDHPPVDQAAAGEPSSDGG